MSENDSRPDTDERDQRSALKPAYEYLQRVARDGSDGVIEESEFASYVDSSVYRNPRTATSTVDRLLRGERYPGEAFDLVVEPDPTTFVPAFLADVGVSHTDVLGIAAPSTQFWEDWVVACYRRLAESGVVLTTKRPARTLCDELDDVDPAFIDATPGSRTDPEADDVTGASATDLTSLGVAVDRTLRQISEDRSTDDPVVFAVMTLTQLTAYHRSTALARFIQEVVGRLRRRSVGGVIHLPPEATPRGELSGVTTSLDYVIEPRVTEGGVVQARVRGKRDADERWRLLGFLNGAGGGRASAVDRVDPPAVDEHTPQSEPHADGE